MSYERVTPKNLADVLLLEPKVFSDERGFFLESFNQRDFEEAIGKSVNFVQDNHSCSQQGVLRGLHFQIRHPQGKLVRVTHGEVFDVVVDLRHSSPCFGQHTCTRLSSATITSFGFHLALPMDSWCSVKLQNFFIRPQTTGIQNMSEPCSGVIRNCRLIGLLRIPNFLPKIFRERS